MLLLYVVYQHSFLQKKSINEDFKILCQSHPKNADYQHNEEGFSD